MPTNKKEVPHLKPELPAKTMLGLKSNPKGSQLKCQHKQKRKGPANKQDIFNGDETGLFWQMLPDKSLRFTQQKNHGGKQPKTRMTLLVAANISGSEKLALYVNGKYTKPRPER